MFFINIAHLTKDEIVSRFNWHCTHKHNGLEHPQCYAEFHKDNERVGFLDIEASNLAATFGIVYTYCIKRDKGEILKRAVSIKDLYNGLYDKNILKQFIKDCEEFDRLIVHYGTDRRFDIPFLRTRAVKWGLPFPEYKFCNASDTYPILRNKFKLHSNRLETACDFYDIPSKEHKLKPDIWLMMITGNPRLMKKAIDYILKHNIEDVVSLELLWHKINKFVKMSKTSL